MFPETDSGIETPKKSKKSAGEVLQKSNKHRSKLVKNLVTITISILVAIEVIIHSDNYKM
jgi:hypothetical protein